MWLPCHSTMTLLFLAHTIRLACRKAWGHCCGFTWSEFQHVSSLLSNMNFFPNCFTSLFSTELTLEKQVTQSQWWTWCFHICQLTDRTRVTTYFTGDKKAGQDITPWYLSLQQKNMAVKIYAHLVEIQTALTDSALRCKSTWTPCCILKSRNCRKASRRSLFTSASSKGSFSASPPLDRARVASEIYRLQIVTMTWTKNSNLVVFIYLYIFIFIHCMENRTHLSLICLIWTLRCSGVLSIVLCLQEGQGDNNR